MGLNGGVLPVKTLNLSKVKRLIFCPKIFCPWGFSAWRLRTYSLSIWEEGCKETRHLNERDVEKSIFKSLGDFGGFYFDLDPGKNHDYIEALSKRPRR